MTQVELHDVLSKEIEIIQNLKPDDPERTAILGNADMILRLSKQMINNADVILRTDKLVSEGKLGSNSVIVKIVGTENVPS